MRKRSGSRRNGASQLPPLRVSARSRPFSTAYTSPARPRSVATAMVVGDPENPVARRIDALNWRLDGVGVRDQFRSAARRSTRAGGRHGRLATTRPRSRPPRALRAVVALHPRTEAPTAGRPRERDARCRARRDPKIGRRRRRCLVTRRRRRRRDTTELARELFGVELAIGSVDAIVQRAGEALAAPHTRLEQQLKNAPVVTSTRPAGRPP